MSTFEEVLKVFGGSVFPEDYRVNLKAVRQYLEPQARGADEYNETVAVHDLLSSIYYALCGKLKEARSRFGRVTEHVDELPARWKLRNASYQAYHLFMRRHPPLLRFRSEMSSVSAYIRDAETSWPEEAIRLASIFSTLEKELRSNLSQSDSLEAFVMSQLLFDHGSFWSFSFPLHPAHPRVVWNMSENKENTTQAVVGSITTLQRMKQLLIHNGIHDLLINPDIRLCQLFYGGDEREDVVKMLPQARADCAKRDDLVGQALYKMFEADSLLSPPFSNPMALNLLAIDGHNAGCDNAIWDLCEDSLILKDDSAAQDIYQDAHDLFHQSGSTRGCGAIVLRLSAILLNGIAFDQSLSGEARETNIDQVEVHHRTALQQFAEDEASCQFVKGHQVVLHILKARTDISYTLAEDIGTWGRLNENEGIAHFVGSMLVRFGRRNWVDYNRVDIALSCFDHAQTLFMSLDDPVAASQAMHAKTEVNRALSDDTKTRTMIKEDIAMFAKGHRRLTNLMESTNDENTEFFLTSQRKMLLQSFDAFIKQILATFDDTNASEMWKQQLSSWGPDSGLMTRFEDQKWDDQASSFISRKEKGSTMSSLMERANFTVAVSAAYNNATNRSRDHMIRFDVVEGVRIIDEFCLELETMPGALVTKVTWAIIASFVNGNREFSARYLSMVSDEEMLNTSTESLFMSDVAWCRNDYDRRLSNLNAAETALSVCVMAHNWTRAARILRDLQTASPGFLDPTGPDRAVDQWTRFIWAGLVAEHNDDLASAMQRYLAAEQQLTYRRSRSGDMDTKLASLSALSSTELYIGLARTCLRCLDTGIALETLTGLLKESDLSSPGSWQQLAAFYIERGRSRTLLESLWSKGGTDADVDTYDPADTMAHKQRLQILLQSLPDKSHTATTRKELAELNAELEKLHINYSLAHNELPREPEAVEHDLYKYLSEGDLFVENGIQYAQVHDFRRFDVRDHVYKVMKGVNDYKTLYKAYVEGERVGPEMESITDQMSAELKAVSEMILNPIAELVRSCQHIIFCSGPPLMAFPFSALPFDDEPLFRSTAISTSPSLAVYANLSSQQTSFTPKLASVVKPGSQRDWLLKYEKELPYAAIESMLISNQFNTWPHMAKKLTGARFCKLIEDCTIRHLGTHCKIHPDSPWMSSISLKNDFRVIDLAKAKSKANLVVFAACLSGQGTASGNELLGFAYAVLQMGASAYLGALWEVEEISTMLLMIFFYRAIINNPTPNVNPDENNNPSRTLAHLWRSAMHTFYNTAHHHNSSSSASLKNLIGSLLTELDSCTASGRDLDGIYPRARTELLRLRDDQDTATLQKIDFRHPFFYASFVLTGFGGLVCDLP